MASITKLQCIAFNRDNTSFVNSKLVLIKKFNLTTGYTTFS